MGVGGQGVGANPMRSTAKLDLPCRRCTTLAMISALNPDVSQSLSTTNNLPVFSTEAAIVSVSNGLNQSRVNHFCFDANFFEVIMRPQAFHLHIRNPDQGDVFSVGRDAASVRGNRVHFFWH